MSVRPVTEGDRVETGKCWWAQTGGGGAASCVRNLCKDIYSTCCLIMISNTDDTLLIVWPQCCLSRPVVSSTRTPPELFNQANTAILTGVLGEDLICTRPFVDALQRQRTTWLNQTPFIIGCHPGLPHSMWLWVWDWSVGVLSGGPLLDNTT